MFFRIVYKSGQIFLPFVTIHACDRRTDGQTEFSSLDRVCIPGSAVKPQALAYVPWQLQLTIIKAKQLDKQLLPVFSLMFFNVLQFRIRMRLPCIFLPRCMQCRRGLAMRILSVCLSVRLSHTWIVTKRKKDLSRFLYHTKD